MLVDPVATELQKLDGTLATQPYGLLVVSPWLAGGAWAAEHAAWCGRLREADPEGCLYAMPAHSLHTTVATLT